MAIGGAYYGQGASTQKIWLQDVSSAGFCFLCIAGSAVSFLRESPNTLLHCCSKCGPCLPCVFGAGYVHRNRV